MMTNKKIRPTTIDIKNFKSIWKIEKLNIDSEIIPIIGINGAGKSNILKAIDWFANNNSYHSDKKKINNIYKLDAENEQTVVRFNFADDFKEEFESIFDLFLEEIIDEFDDESDSENEIKKYIGKLKNKKTYTLIKTSYKKIGTTNERSERYSFNKPFDVEFINYTNDVVNDWISDWILTRVLKERMIKIYLMDTKKTLSEFDKGENSEEKSDGFRFSELFRFTEYASKNEEKFKLISKVLEGIDEGMTFDDFIKLSNSNSSNVTFSDKVKSDEYYEIIEKFSEKISTNGFFRSINSDSSFKIFPVFSANEFEVESDGSVEVNENQYKLVLSDIVQDSDGKERHVTIENMSFKNDGFIFALMISLQIEFLLEDESILLIDEPANFLSVASTRLLIENFKRINEERNIKFVYTTHSSQTLDKTIVPFEQIIITRKQKDFCTHVLNIKNSKINELEISPEFEIVREQYGVSKKHIEVIPGETNFVAVAKNELESEIIKFINQYSKFNWISTYEMDTLTNNVRKYAELDPDFKKPELKQIISINLIDKFEADEVCEIFYDVLATNRTVDIMAYKRNPEYKKEILLELFRGFSGQYARLKKLLKNSNKEIKEEVKKLESKHVENL